MFDRIKELWNTYGFEILVCSAILIIIILALFRIGKKGSWSTSYYIESNKSQYNPPLKKSAPKESKGEAECRRVLQQLTGKPFISIRPDFLRNPVTGGNFNLEIDCYNEEMKLGIEYNGIQHYQYKPFFHRNKEAFRNQLYRDEMKRGKCKENGIRLIEVPYTIKLEDISAYLKKKLVEEGYIKT